MVLSLLIVILRGCQGKENSLSSNQIEFCPTCGNKSNQDIYLNEANKSNSH